MTAKIEITKVARDELSRLLGDGGAIVRLALRPGGCAGMTYKWSFVRTPRRHDVTVYDDGDLRVVAEAGESAFMHGLEMHFSSALLDRGFKYVSPSSRTRCLCGASFTVE